MKSPKVILLVHMYLHLPNSRSCVDVTDEDRAQRNFLELAEVVYGYEVLYQYNLYTLMIKYRLSFINTSVHRHFVIRLMRSELWQPKIGKPTWTSSCVYNKQIQVMSTETSYIGTTTLTFLYLDLFRTHRN